MAGEIMLFNQVRKLLAVFLITLLWVGNAQASNRWDVLRWCTTNTPTEIARCEGFLNAAVDLRSSDEFAGPRPCFAPQTRLSKIRVEVVAWLKENKTAREKSGLALVSRAIQERFSCIR